MKNSFAFCRENGQCTKDSYSYVSTDNEQTLMSTVARQPVSVAIERDQFSFQLYMSGVLTASRGMSRLTAWSPCNFKNGCEKRLKGHVSCAKSRKKAADRDKSQSAEGECRQFSTLLLHIRSSVFSCTPAPTVIMRVVDLWLKCLEK